MRFVTEIEFDNLCEKHRRLGNFIDYESTQPDNKGNFLRVATVTYKYKTPRSQGTFTKVVDEYCTFYFANIADGED